MLVNLVENAINHTQMGACIVVSLAPVDGQGPDLVVADDGLGIPESERDKVFRRFYRLDTSRTTSGSGLGLNLVAAIIALHSAHIDLEDNHPGLLVRVSFPECGVAALQRSR